MNRDRLKRPIGDSDGNRMEFQVDCGTVGEAYEFMTRPAFAENPVGVRYDPDRLLERYETGESVDLLVKRLDGAASAITHGHRMT